MFINPLTYSNIYPQMETTPFDIELVRQKTSDNCVKACVQMVLNYYDFVYKKKDITLFSA